MPRPLPAPSKEAKGMQNNQTHYLVVSAISNLLVTSETLFSSDHPCHFNVGVLTMKKPVRVGQHFWENFHGGVETLSLFLAKTYHFPYIFQNADVLRKCIARELLGCL